MAIGPAATRLIGGGPGARNWQTRAPVGNVRRRLPAEEMKMQPMTIHARRFLASEDGPTVCEYAIMLALIVTAAIAAIRLLGERMQAIFAVVTGSIS